MPDGAANDYFGCSVSISGDYAIVGAWADDDQGENSGAAYLFKWNGTNWIQETKLVPTDGIADARFGYAVSISGDYAIVGAHFDDAPGNASGSAYIFKRDGTNWLQEAKLVPMDGAAGDYFGVSVAIFGDYAIIGAHGDDNVGYSSGSAYVFKRDGSNWIEEVKLISNDSAAYDYFGGAVSISMDYAIVGAWANDARAGNSGAAYIFKRDGASWFQEAKLAPSDGAIEDHAATSVSIVGEYAIMNSRGGAYIFKRDGTSWMEETKLVPSDGLSGHDFGSSVALSGNYIIVGAKNDADTGVNSGSAYIFRRDETGWREEAKIRASDGGMNDIFGDVVSIAGHDSIIGARWDNGNTGSAYIYKLGNYPPTDITLDNRTVTENQQIGTTVGMLSTIDPDGEPTYTYTLVSGAGDTGNGSFTIDGNTLKTNAIFDYEIQASYSIRIQPDDGNGGVYQKTFTITVRIANHLWSRQFGNTFCDDMGRDVATDTVGNVIMIGYFVGSVDFGGGVLTSSGSDDIFLAKYDAHGNHLWSRRFGDTGYDTGYGVATDTAGNILVIGKFSGSVDFGGGVLTSGGSDDIFLAKYDANGMHLWSHRFGGPGIDAGISVTTDAAGNVLMTGEFTGSVDFGGGALTSAGSEDIILAKYAADGSHLWSKRFGNTGIDYGEGVATDATGNVLLTGFFMGSTDFGGGALTSAGGYDIILAQYAANGTHLWSNRFGSIGNDIGRDVVTDAEGNIFLTGVFMDNVNFGGGVLSSAGSYDIILAKYAANGSHVWSQRVGDAESDSGNGVATDTAGNVFMSGSFMNDIFLAKYAVDGTHIWSHRIGVPNGSETGFGVATDAAGNVLATGAFGVSADFGGGVLTSAGCDDIFLARYGMPNQSPTDLTLSNSSVAENQAVSTPVGTFTTTDPEVGDTHTYTLTTTGCAGTENASFSISGDQLLTNAVFDYETKASYAICVQTDDGKGGTYTETFTIAVTDQYALTVQKDGTGHGVVNSSPSGIDCGSDNTEEYAPDTIVTLTATPETGSLLTNWSGGGCTGTMDCLVTMDSSKTVTATFTYQGSSACANVTELPKTECEALVALYHSTNGDNWMNHTGWLQTPAPCSWYGVTCTTGHITELQLQSNQLSGSIPSEIGNLTSLTVLYLYQNQLSGNIPAAIGDLVNLKNLQLRYNQLTGSIPPSVGNLVNLEYLKLELNQLSGNLPSELGNLTKLYFLSLSNNQFQGNLPAEIGNLVNLEQLYVDHNQFGGALPGTLTNLTRLDRLYFNNTNICEPSDPALQTWLSGISEVQRTGVSCSNLCWMPLTGGTSYRLTSIWGNSNNDVFAVGYEGTILHYDGSIWTPMTSGTSRDLHVVWGTAPNNVYAAGGDLFTNTILLHYDGNNWAEMPIETLQPLTGIWGTSPSDVWAVGYDQTKAAFHYDGTSWTVVTNLPSTMKSLWDIWGNSSHDIFAVGDNGAHTIFHYNGSSWTKMITGTSTSEYFTGIWGTSGQNVFAVGYHSSTQTGHIFYYDGTSWNKVFANVPNLQEVWGGAGNDIFAVGKNGTILHYAGTAWEAMKSGVSSYLFSVWGTSGSDVFAVGDGGTILHYGNHGFELAIDTIGTGTGSVNSVPAGIDCGSDCTETYLAGTEVTLSAIPGISSTFTGWSGGGCSGTGNCTVMLNTNIAVTATFQTPEINVKQGIALLPSGAGSYHFNLVNVGATSSTIIFTIENLGMANLTLSGIQKTGSHPNDFIVTQPLSSTVASGSSTTFTVMFAPTATGTRTATISIANNDNDENPYTFTVNGTGQASNSFLLWTK